MVAESTATTPEEALRELCAKCPEPESCIPGFSSTQHLGDYLAIIDLADHVHDWEEMGPLQVRREGSKAAYVTVPGYWCASCGAVRVDGKIRWPKRIAHPPPAAFTPEG